MIAHARLKIKAIPQTNKPTNLKKANEMLFG